MHFPSGELFIYYIINLLILPIDIDVRRKKKKRVLIEFSLMNVSIPKGNRQAFYVFLILKDVTEYDMTQGGRKKRRMK